MACGTIVGNQTAPRVAPIAWESEMREKTLGRWIVRLAVTIGFGSVALGLSAAAASADPITIVRFHPLPGSVSAPAVTNAGSAQVFVTEDFAWE
ncbi:hypothetical protein GCM10020218_071860 [Dactylosporangium vinaceum]